MNRKPYEQPSLSSREQRRAAQRATGKSFKPAFIAAAPLGPRPNTTGGHQHAEAYCLMWYACECGHRERIWNSRDGVTAFGMACPSCNEPKLQHVDWKLDVYAPDHVPAPGQRVWITMTRERALQIARRTVARVAQGKAMPSGVDLSRIADAVFNDGTAPDLIVYGYAEAS
jgi:hypothetical protein